jgi:hypothetical protein
MSGKETKGEPVAWRTRYRSEPGMIGHYPWTYTERIRGMRLDQYEYEPLFSTPPAPTTEPTAKPITGLTEEEQRKLIGCFFAEDWAVRKALDLLHDFTRALAEKNGLAVQGGEHA